MGVGTEAARLREVCGACNSKGFDKGLFLIFRGYMDESCDDDFFVLSCSMAKGSRWDKLSNEWGRYLRNINARLRRQGRPQISEYHASDCGGRGGDFEGWTVEEQIQLTKDLIGIIHRCRMESVVYVLNRKEQEEVFHFVKTPNDLMAGMYLSTTQFCMQGVGERAELFPHPPNITLIHDHCDYDANMLDAFNIMKFGYGSDRYRTGRFFDTIAAVDSKQYKPVQVADLIAYEALNDIRRQEGKRRGAMKKSLKAMLASTSFSIDLRLVPKTFMESIRDYNISVMDDAMRARCGVK